MGQWFNVAQYRTLYKQELGLSFQGADGRDLDIFSDVFYPEKITGLFDRGYSYSVATPPGRAGGILPSRVTVKPRSCVVTFMCVYVTDAGGVYADATSWDAFIREDEHHGEQYEQQFWDTWRGAEVEAGRFLARIERAKSMRVGAPSVNSGLGGVPEGFSGGLYAFRVRSATVQPVTFNAARLVCTFDVTPIPVPARTYTVSIESGKIKTQVDAPSWTKIQERLEFDGRNKMLGRDSYVCVSKIHVPDGAGTIKIATTDKPILDYRYNERPVPVDTVIHIERSGPAKTGQAKGQDITGFASVFDSPSTVYRWEPVLGMNGWTVTDYTFTGQASVEISIIN